MSAIDFSRSYMRWFGAANNVRILIEAACTLTDDDTGKSESYYLIAPCRGERTHADADLIQMPSYEFCGIWGENEKRIIRTHWVSDRDGWQYVEKADTLDIRKFSRTRRLTDNDAVLKATMESSEPLVSRTTLRHERRGLTAVLEYPVNTMNVKEDPVRFQVDTGPIIFPDFNIQAARPIESFEVAYVVYNRFDEAEFVARKPVPIIVDKRTVANTTDYSQVRVMPARNELLLAEPD